jgi:4-hydroxybenzoate polyprenyltransferase
LFSKLKYYILLTRPLNLGIILITQAAFMAHAADYKAENILLSQAILVALSTILTAAAGNVINDIFDIEEDQINNPEKRIIARHVSTKNGRIFYGVLAAASLIAGYFSGWTMFALCITIGIMLYFYSSDIKGETLWGNLLVAFMAGAVVFTADLGVFTRNEGYFAEYALMAFLITVPREIVKDIEDIIGDKSQGYRTFPIVFGTKRSTRLAVVFMTMLVAEIVYMIITDGNVWYAVYTAGLVVTPSVYIIVKLFRAEVKSDFKQLSGLLKLLMFTGLISVLFL